MAVQMGYKQDGTYGILDAGDIMAANQSAFTTADQIGSVANVQTPSSAFQGAYTGILKNTGQTGTSTDPMDFQAGSIDKAIWADEKGINELGMGTDKTKDSMLLGMNPDQWGSALKMGQIGIGAGQLGLGLASYFQNKGLADKQKELLGQQIESNRSEIDARKNYRSALEGFGSQSQPTRI